MKKTVNIVLALLLTVGGLMTTNTNVLAATQTTGWDVSFDGTKLSSNYDLSKATVTSVMPGDTIIYDVSYKNDAGTAADFFLSTEVITSLEEGAGGEESGAYGGAYAYKLSYDIGAGPVVIYDSETIGGEGADVLGLKQIQGTLDNDEKTFFSIGTLEAGKQGQILVEIQLDGNSQDNSYMEKLATLDIVFGAEKVSQPTPNIVKNTSVNRVVQVLDGGTQVVVIDDDEVPLAGGPQTGDSILPLLICSAAMSFGLLLIGWYLIVLRNKKEEVA